MYRAHISLPLSSLTSLPPTHITLFPTTGSLSTLMFKTKFRITVTYMSKIGGYYWSMGQHHWGIELSPSQQLLTLKNSSQRSFMCPSHLTECCRTHLNTCSCYGFMIAITKPCLEDISHLQVHSTFLACHIHPLLSYAFLLQDAPRSWKGWYWHLFAGTEFSSHLGPAGKMMSQKSWHRLTVAWSGYINHENIWLPWITLSKIHIHSLWKLNRSDSHIYLLASHINANV